MNPRSQVLASALLRERQSLLLQRVWEEKTIHSTQIYCMTTVDQALGILGICEFEPQKHVFFWNVA